MINQVDSIEMFRPNPDQNCICGKQVLFKNCCGSSAKKGRPPRDILVKRSFLPSETCDKLVAYAYKQNDEHLKVRKTDAKSGKVFEEEDSNRVASKINLNDKQSTIDKWVSDIFYKFVEKKINKKICTIEEPQLMHYKEGGLYLPHSDSEFFDQDSQQWKRIFDRDYSLLLYLNDDFEGGSVHFTYFNYTFEPKKGDLLLFPSNYLFLHEARRVESGNRFVIVSWTSVK